MSQYPSPYQTPSPPGYGYGYPPQAYAPPPDLLHPARAAGVMMIVLGILAALGAGCLGVGGTLMADHPQMAEVVAEQERQTGMGFGLWIKVVTTVFAVPAFVLILLGLFVRRGRFVAIVIGIAVTGLSLAGVGLLLLSALYVAAQGETAGIMAAAVQLVILALLALQLFWLVKAAMNVGPLKVFNEQHQAYQYQMHQAAAAQQQYQQMYGRPQQTYPPPPPSEGAHGPPT